MQGSISVASEQEKKKYDVFSVALVMVVVVAVGVALVVYRHAYDAGLSVKPDNWSAFGSFIGGVFGPLISFLTLLAILKTIGLQKLLLDTQRIEFEAMQALQVKVIEAQLSQIERSDIESARRLIEESRISALQALDRYMREIRSEYEQKRIQLNSLYQWVVDGKAKTSSDEIVRITEKLSEYEEALAAMTVLYGDICFGEFKSVEVLRKQFKDGLAQVWISKGKESPVHGA